MVSVTFNIPDEKYAAFEEAFLECHNVPVDRETGEPTMSNRAWVKEWGRRMYVAAARQGAKRVRDKAHPVTFTPEIT
jgi:hypothetical protein